MEVTDLGELGAGRRRRDLCVLGWAGLDFDWEMRLMGEREVKSSQAQLTPDT